MDERHIAIKGIRPYDGEYPLDSRAFNAREWHWIKRISGYMPFTVQDGMAGGDPDLFVALAVIALARAGKIERSEGLRVAEVIAEVPFDGAAIQLVIPEEEEDELPLELTSEPGPSSQSRPLEKQTSSGDPSIPTTGQSEKTPESTGTSELPMSPTWGRSRLVS